MTDPLRIYATACLVIAAVFASIHWGLNAYERRRARKLRSRPSP